MTTAMQVAKERRLEWLLQEVHGGGSAAAPSPTRATFSWLAAAIALLGVGVAIGVGWLHKGDSPRRDVTPANEPVQEPEPPWHECHGPAALADVPADVTALRCFDFDDAACAALAKFAQLEHLDLSGTDADEQGVSRSLTITDAGVRALAPLTALRSLRLAQCHAVKGEGLQVLEAMPRLELLDLTYSGVESPGIERLQRLPSLRTLVLSHCMNFHGRSLAAVARIPGLRRLELSSCTTLAAADVLTLTALRELRWLDLRDCQGSFRGQTMSSPWNGEGDEPPAPPTQDGIGITDAVVAALATLPLETLLLGGSESLTDAIGSAFAKLPSLRRLDLSNLPKTTPALLAQVPAGLEALELSDNPHLDGRALRRLPTLRALRELGLSDTGPIDAADLERLLADCDLRVLRFGGASLRGKGDARTPGAPFTAAHARVIAAETSLVELDLRDRLLEPDAVAPIATLPALTTLNLGAPWRRPLQERTAAVKALAGCRSLRELRVWYAMVDPSALAALREVPLRILDLRATSLTVADVRAAAAAWPGCSITLPNGAPLRVP